MAERPIGGTLRNLYNTEAPAEVAKFLRAAQGKHESACHGDCCDRINGFLYFKDSSTSRDVNISSGGGAGITTIAASG